MKKGGEGGRGEGEGRRRGEEEGKGIKLNFIINIPHVNIPEMYAFHM